MPETAPEHARDYAGIALAYAKEAAADEAGVKFCKWVRLAARRHLDDIERSAGDWPYYFDEWHANDVCDFIEKLPHIEGQWETANLRLEAPQIFILGLAFGWRRKADGLRRFTTAYLEMARKGAKSTLTAGVSLYCTACEGEPGPLALIAATTGDQARKVFNPASQMVKRTADLREAFGFQAWARAITCADTGGTIQTINAKSSTQDGHNPHLAVLDELHAHKDRGLYDVIRSAFGSRRNPLLWMITTAGFDQYGVCYEQRTFLTKVLERAVIAEHYFGVIFTLDEGDDPFDETKWIKANPLLPVTPKLDELRGYAIEAKASPASEGEFKTKRLNVWMNAASAWLNVAQWNACANPRLRLRDFRGLDCFIGADLADKDDVTAIGLAALTEDGRLLWKPWFYLPRAVLDRASQTDRDNATLYRQWSDEGHLILTPGDFVDHNRVERRIRRLEKALGIRRVTFDQFAAAQGMAARLNEDLANGDEPFAVVMHKNAPNCTDPAKDIEARLKVGPTRLEHDGNPVMAWMVSNAVVTRHVNGSIIPKKETPDSKNKIDGVDALINAISPMQLPLPDQSSVYEERGILVL